MEGFSTQGFSFDLPKGNSSIIKVIGVGGGGNNALKHMYERGIHGVDFVVCNTDAQTLDNNPVANKVQLGITMTEGLGAGADPEVGEKAAIESIDEIKASLGQNTKMVFITAGMGGGTGTGAAPVIAKVAKEMGILTVGIVTVPFGFEGKRRLEQAELGLEKLRNNVDSLIVINNDKLRQQFGNLGFKQGFSKADEVLTNAAKGMAEVITGYFDVNIDFRDAKSVLANSGTALMSTGTASGENKAEEAVRKALDSPLLNDNKITGAKNVLLLIRSGSEEATMDEIGLINDYIQKEAGNTADIIFGVGTDEELGDAISVLVIATGFAKENLKHSGPIEKVKYNLHDEVKKEKRVSPFTSKKDEAPIDTESKPKNVFFLEDDEDEGTTQFKSLNSEKKMIAEEETAAEPTLFAGTEQELLDPDYEDINLFSFAESDDDLQSESFTFEVEGQAVSKNTPAETEEAAPVEFTFSINDPIEEEFYTEKIEEQPQPKPDASYGITQNNSSESSGESPKAANSVAETTVVTQQKTEEEGGFTFFQKAVTDEQKVQDRRNKLKEFNSRYQNYESELDLDKVPAYKRRNIAIDGQNASEQNIGSFLLENEKGEIQIRENRFLNKDVD